VQCSSRAACNCSAPLGSFAATKGRHYARAGGPTPGGFSARISGDVVSTPGQFTFSVAANSEPAEWMLLLFGLLFAGFIAWRKIGLMGSPAWRRLIPPSAAAERGCF